MIVATPQTAAPTPARAHPRPVVRGAADSGDSGTSVRTGLVVVTVVVIDASSRVFVDDLTVPGPMSRGTGTRRQRTSRPQAGVPARRRSAARLSTVVITRVPMITTSDTQIGMSGAHVVCSPPLMN